ncbi:MAG: DUF4159 domain-containing protein [Sedimentisphaerales bacterium]|nr:DUF4159 domain-containing protein [Sedimentisphaerales bacterium]
MNRRIFLKTVAKSAGLVFLSGKLFASARQEFSHLSTTKINEQQTDDLDKYDFIMPRVKFTPIKVPGRGEGPDLWNVRPGGDRNLMDHLSTVIRCKTKPILNVGQDGFSTQYADKEGQLNAIVTFDNPERINKFPFLFMTDENEFQFNLTQKNNLRDYIKRGGFLFMDDCVVGNGGDFFYQSAYRLLEDVFGRNSVKSISREHEIFHNVYDLGSIGLPHMKGQNHGAKGVFSGNRLAIFLSSNDIHCGWCDNSRTNFPPMKYEQALQMGINIIMYAISH